MAVMIIFDDEPKKRLDWSKVSTAAAIVMGVFGAMMAVATAVKTLVEAYESVKRNLPERPDQDEETKEPRRIVVP